MIGPKPIEVVSMSIMVNEHRNLVFGEVVRKFETHPQFAVLFYRGGVFDRKKAMFYAEFMWDYHWSVCAEQPIPLHFSLAEIDKDRSLQTFIRNGMSAYIRLNGIHVP
jgi:hypothetical protein